MKCPLEMAGDLSAEGGQRVNHSAGMKRNETITRGRPGLADEVSGGDLARLGREDDRHS